MKKHLLAGIMAVLALGVVSTAAQAKWWIFGQSQDEVSIKYLLINGQKADESGPVMEFYRDALPNGLIYIKGKAAAGKNKIGSVQVSINNQQAWEKAKTASDGAFEFSFKPETGQQYQVSVKALDTRGKSNDIKLTQKTISVKDATVKETLISVLDAMAGAYSSKNTNGFMSHISENFAGDKSVLNSAIRKDFSVLDNIELKLTVNNVTVNDSGKIFVSINYSRSLTASQTGTPVSDHGITEFTFESVNGTLVVTSMKTPLLFGVTNPEVATGNVETKANDGAITGGLEGGGGGTASPGTPLVMTYNNVPFPFSFQSFSFASGAKYTETWGTTTGITGDFGIYGDAHHVVTRAGVSFVDMGITTLSSITTAPSSGYITSTGGNHLSAGHCYIFKLPGGSYGAIQAVSLTIPVSTLMYKYSASSTFE